MSPVHISRYVFNDHCPNRKFSVQSAIDRPSKLISQQTEKIIKQSENWENHNAPDLVQAFPKKMWVESDFTDDIGIALPLSIPQIACRVDYIMVNCLIDAVHKYIIKKYGHK
jgi:hypothetical protein